MTEPHGAPASRSLGDAQFRGFSRRAARPRLAPRLLFTGGMGTDVWVLLQRDHHELDEALAAVFAPWTTMEQKHEALVRFRVGFIAHAEGQAEALRATLDDAVRPSPVHESVTRTLAAHAAQASVLHDLERAASSDARWHDAARQLRDLHRAHVADEGAARAILAAHLPATAIATLARTYATARLRTLAMLPPMSWRST